MSTCIDEDVVIMSSFHDLFLLTFYTCVIPLGTATASDIKRKLSPLQLSFNPLIVIMNMNLHFNCISQRNRKLY